MSSLLEILSDIPDNLSPWGEWRTDNVGNATWNRTIKGNSGKPYHYTFSAKPMVNPNGETVANIAFKTQETEHGLTGDTNAITVLQYALAFIREYIKTFSPRNIEFNARKPSVDYGTGQSEARARVYDKLIKKFASKFGYQAKTNETPKEVSFVLTKIK